MKKGKGGASHSGHHHAGPEPTHVKKRIGPAEHDQSGYHNVAYGHHRLNVGKHRLEYIRKPCKNRHCRSYGSSHPNCKCYGKMAEGGEVSHFCDADHMHEGGCPYYSQGGDVQKGMNLSNFKKIKEDKKTVIMGHPDGHQITISKNALSALHRKQIEKLPIHLDEGGDPSADQASEPAPAPQPMPTSGGSSSGLEDYSAPSEPQKIMPVGDGKDLVQAPPAIQQDPNSAQSTIPPSSNMVAQNSGLPNVVIGDVYKQSMAGIHEKQQAEIQLAQENANLERHRQQEIEQEYNNIVTKNAELQKKVDAALQDVKNGHIKPNQYLENMGTGQKVATAIGLLLGGFSGGFNRTGSNPAAEWLTGQINRDIDAQKAGLNNKQNVYHAYMEQFHNAQVAEELTRATHLGVYASNIKEAGDKAGTPMAKANADMAAAEIQRNILPLITNANLLNGFTQFNAGASGNGSQQSGSEEQYVAHLNAAQILNPQLYSDQQSKYVPRVGVATHPVAEQDRQQLQSLDELLPLLNQAEAFQHQMGMTGTALSFHPINNAADAGSLYNSLNVSLNKVTGLSRLNEREYKNYGEQIGELGKMNFGGTEKTITNLKNLALSERNSLLKSTGIKPFADAKIPGGPSSTQQKNLDIFLDNNPKYKQNPQEVIDLLKSKGLF